MPDDKRGTAIECIGPTDIEFNWPLFVHKKKLRGQSDYLYTIAVWKGTTLVAICHLQPLETAITMLSRLLRDAGIPRMTNGVIPEFTGSGLQPSESIPHGNGDGKSIS